MRLMPRQTGPELKVVDVNIGNATSIPLSTTATVNPLNELNTGAEMYQRIGRKVMFKTLHFTGNIIPSNIAGSALVADYIRIWVIYDHEQNFSVATYNQLIQSVNFTGATSSTSYDFTAPGYFERFEVLADIKIDAANTDLNTTPVSGAVTDYSKNEVNINRYIKLRNLTSHYDPGAAIPALPVTGAMYLVTQGTQPLASAPYQLNWTMRLRYHDF